MEARTISLSHTETDAHPRGPRVDRGASEAQGPTRDGPVIPDGWTAMRLLTYLAARLAGARRRRAAAREPCDGGSFPERARAALKPDQATWLVTRAVSLRAF